MKKILFFPLLRMPSGHHQVADSLAAILQKRDENIICKKIDLLSEWSSTLENLVTKTYLEWIHLFPKNYAWVYKKMAYQSKGGRSYKYYEFLFMKKVKQIIEQEKPDLIVCTHGFPSYFMSRLKSKMQCNVPVINVYTDFFINDVWGREGIDYHFVPSGAVKNKLIKENGIPEHRIIVTGIPTNEQFEPKITSEVGNSFGRRRVLVSGGSVGLGNIIEMIEEMNGSDIEYYVLCGSNQKLLQKISQLQKPNIHPLPYISSREEMDQLYSQVDAIITKPGGVTISEALKKGLPIFIHSALPGQEEINLKLLTELKLVRILNQHSSINEQMDQFFKNPMQMEQFHLAQKAYLKEIENGHPSKIAQFISCLIDSSAAKQIL
ncbi:MGDG synthase family glycosyltransferase [Pseudoneobacillus sp. C159]